MSTFCYGHVLVLFVFDKFYLFLLIVCYKYSRYSTLNLSSSYFSPKIKLFSHGLIFSKIDTTPKCCLNDLCSRDNRWEISKRLFDIEKKHHVPAWTFKEKDHGTGRV